MGEVVEDASACVGASACGAIPLAEKLADPSRFLFSNVALNSIGLRPVLDLFPASEPRLRFTDPLLIGNGTERFDTERADCRMGQAQRAHRCTARDGPAALGPSYRYFVPYEFPEYAAKTQPGSVNLRLFRSFQAPCAVCLISIPPQACRSATVDGMCL